MNIVSLAYGSEGLYHQLMFSLLTLHYHLKGDFKNINIVVYTDNREIFNKYLSGLPITIESLSRQQAQKFKGPTGYNTHRVKTCILKHCLEKHEGDVFYIDCDTFFLKNPVELLKKISADVSILNAFEYDLYDAGGWENQLWFLLRSAIRDHNFLVDGQKIKIPLTTKMWNAGITGISRSNAHLVDSILELTDQIFDITPVFHAEQFAVSYMLQEHTQVVSTEDYLEHYWSRDTKARFTHHFRAFFAEHQGLPLPDLADKAHSFFLDRANLPVPKQKREPVLRRLQYRLRLIMQVARKGHL